MCYIFMKRTTWMCVCVRRSLLRRRVPSNFLAAQSCSGAHYYYYYYMTDIYELSVSLFALIKEGGKKLTVFIRSSSGSDVETPRMFPSWIPICMWNGKTGTKKKSSLRRKFRGKTYCVFIGAIPFWKCFPSSYRKKSIRKENLLAGPEVLSLHAILASGFFQSDRWKAIIKKGDKNLN